MKSFLFNFTIKINVTKFKSLHPIFIKGIYMQIMNDISLFMRKIVLMGKTYVIIQVFLYSLKYFINFNNLFKFLEVSPYMYTCNILKIKYINIHLYKIVIM